MVKQKTIVRHAGQLVYIPRVQRTHPGNLIGYWPLDDTSTIALDYSRTVGGNGTHVGDTQLAAHNPFAKKCPLFDGTNDYVSIYSAALNAVFSSSTLTLAAWVRVQSLGDWTNGEIANVFQIGADANNRVGIYKAADNSCYARSIAGGTTATSSAYTSTTTDWLSLAATLDRAADELRFYAAGELVSTTGTLGVWAGVLADAYCRIGCDHGATDAWRGYLCHAAVWNVALPADEIFYLAKRH